MRLALKLLSCLALVTVLVLAVSAIVEYRRRDELIAMDIENDARMAIALRAVTLKVAELAGPTAAHEMIDTLNENAARDIRWLDVSQIPHIPGRDLPAEVLANMQSGEP